MNIDYLQSRWASIRAGLISTVDKFEADDLSFRPFEGSWSVHQLLLHIAQEEYGEFGYGITGSLKEFPSDYSTDDYPDLDSIRALLEAVHAQTLKYLGKLNDGDLNQVINTPWGAANRQLEMFDHLIEHEIHHRAELSLILGMLGREGFDA